MILRVPNPNPTGISMLYVQNNMFNDQRMELVPVKFLLATKFMWERSILYQNAVFQRCQDFQNTTLNNNSPLQVLPAEIQMMVLSQLDIQAFL
eukprot:TRINITY_DN3015_c0_g1_i3.p1 TRINITY_DN3015_c0_g1~~TRINITY_DN3015_c0_g1_i3.p1  ORF type:complete len:107 (-),score=8.21 TRINITY_DN3015_c0_g1_i3:232-510(-)